MNVEERLGRLVEFDERSRAYPLRGALREVKPRSHEWALNDLRLDQVGPSCTGAMIVHEAAAEPDPVQGLTLADSIAVYKRAQQLDDWPGENYSGSSVLGALKAGNERGWYQEYRWAFGLEDVVLALSWAGPVALGLNWYEGMEDTGPYAHITVAGDIVGGHAIVATAVDIDNFGGRVKLVNSWGWDWGWHGTCWILFNDLERLLHEDGEAAIPLVRSLAA